MSDLFTPPRFFRDVKFHRHSDRTIGWLELFYDLVYVATLIQIGNFLSDNVSITGFAQFMVMMTVVWWAWTGETFYQNRFVADDLLHRLLLFTQMFAVATLGLSVSEAFGDLYVQFTLAYVVIRLMLILMYLRASRAHPESREFTQGYVAGFSVGVVIWLASLLLPQEYHWVGWLLGISVELAVPQLPGMRQHRIRWGFDVHHITERFGIFTIIVLGESFVKVLDDAQGAQIGPNEMLFSTFGLLVVYSLWWLYFADTEGHVVHLANDLKGVAWVYSHLFLAAGLVAFGVGAKKLFAATIAYPDEAASEEYRLLYTAAIVLYLLALALIDWGINDESTHQSQNFAALVHVASALLVGIIGLTFSSATPVSYVMVVSLIMLIQVGISIYQTTKIPQASPPH